MPARLEFATSLSTLNNLALEELTVPPVAPPSGEIKYIVAVNDNLSSIAAAHATTWTRLYNKNPHITNPDMIMPGMELIIPAADEVLTERPLPAPPPRRAIEPASTHRSTATTSIRQDASSRPAASAATAGNTYARGYCTWYAKHRRPDLPNNLGNADTWLARARAQGLPTGSTPRAGAIGQRGMHVVYVERVNSDSTVTISEMNFKGWGIVSQRTVPASDFMYIY
jgi:surface antigen